MNFMKKMIAVFLCLQVVSAADEAEEIDVSCPFFKSIRSFINGRACSIGGFDYAQLGYDVVSCNDGVLRAVLNRDSLCATEVEIINSGLKEYLVRGDGDFEGRSSAVRRLVSEDRYLELTSFADQGLRDQRIAKIAARRAALQAEATALEAEEARVAHDELMYRQAIGTLAPSAAPTAH